MIGAQWQTLRWRHTHKEQIYAAANARSEDSCRISMREAVELAIAQRRRLARHVENTLTLTTRESLQRRRWGLQLSNERDVFAANERSPVIENVSYRQPHACARR